LKSQAPILPITIIGTSRIMRKGEWRTYPGDVQIIIDPPIETAGIPVSQEAELSAKVRSAIGRNLASAP